MFDNLIMRQIFISILIIFASWFLGYGFKYLFSTIFKKIFSYTKTTLDDQLMVVIRSKIITLSIIAGFYIGITVVRQSVALENLTYHKFLDYLSIALYIILVFVLTKLVSRLIATTIGWYMDEVSAKTHTSVASTVGPLTTKIINIVLYLISSMIVLDHFGVNIGSLLVSLGVGSLAVALAAQETVANMIAGFVILIDQPFRVGDRIKLPSGEEGDVFQIGLRSTRILNFDNNLVVIPNSELVKNRLINFSFPDDSVRVLVEVNVALGTDIEKARKILLNLSKDYSCLLEVPEAQVFVMNISDNGILLRFVARTKHFDKKFEIETGLREKIHKVFIEEGIEIPLPKRVVYNVNSDEAQAIKKK